MTGTAPVPSTDATQAALSAAFSGGALSDPSSGSPSHSGDADYGQMSGFGPDDAAQPPASPGQTQPQSGGGDGSQSMVPSFRLREATERARAAETQNTELLTIINQQRDQLNELVGYVRATAGQQQVQQQAPTPPRAPQIPELFNDPTGFATGIIAEVRDVASNAAKSATETALAASMREARQLKLDASDTIAEARYGREMIRAATHAAKAAGLMQSMMAKPSPVVAAIEWYMGQHIAQRYGTDPASIRENVLAELLQNPDALAEMVNRLRGQQQPQGQPQRPAAPQNQQPLPPAFGAASRGQASLPVPPQATTTEAFRSYFEDQRQTRLGLKPAA